MNESCPHCGHPRPASADAFCAECRRTFDEPPAHSAEPKPIPGWLFGGLLGGALGLLLAFLFVDTEATPRQIGAQCGQTVFATGLVGVILGSVFAARIN
jgi:hypothetical protein